MNECICIQYTYMYLVINRHMQQKNVVYWKHIFVIMYIYTLYMYHHISDLCVYVLSDK